MKAANTRMRSAFGYGRILALVARWPRSRLRSSLSAATSRWRRTRECARLQQAIAARRGSSGVAGGGRASARPSSGGPAPTPRSLGCGNRKFLFFGSEPPPQCGEINAQISRMQANLADLQARAGGGAGDLVARYNAECGHAQPRRRPISSRLCSAAWPDSAHRPRTSRRRTPASRTTAISRAVGPFGREGTRPGALRLLCGLRAHLRRQLLPRFLFRRRQPGGQPRGRLQVPLPQRRRGALFVPVRRHSRRGRVADRRALCRSAQRAANSRKLRPDLLLPAQGAELGGSARRRRGAIWPREARHPGDAGEVGRDGAADH